MADNIINVFPSGSPSFKTKSKLEDILNRLELTARDRIDLKHYIEYGGGGSSDSDINNVPDVAKVNVLANYTIIDNIPEDGIVEVKASSWAFYNRYYELPFYNDYLTIDNIDSTHVKITGPGISEINKENPIVIGDAEILNHESIYSGLDYPFMLIDALQGFKKNVEDGAIKETLNSIPKEEYTIEMLNINKFLYGRLKGIGYIDLGGTSLNIINNIDSIISKKYIKIVIKYRGDLFTGPTATGDSSAGIYLEFTLNEDGYVAQEEKSKMFCAGDTLMSAALFGDEDLPITDTVFIYNTLLLGNTFKETYDFYLDNNLLNYLMYVFLFIPTDTAKISVGSEHIDDSNIITPILFDLRNKYNITSIFVAPKNEDDLYGEIISCSMTNNSFMLEFDVNKSNLENNMITKDLKEYILSFTYPEMSSIDASSSLAAVIDFGITLVDDTSNKAVYKKFMGNVNWYIKDAVTIVFETAPLFQGDGTANDVYYRIRYNILTLEYTIIQRTNNLVLYPNTINGMYNGKIHNAVLYNMLATEPILPIIKHSDDSVYQIYNTISKTMNLETRDIILKAMSDENDVLTIVKYKLSPDGTVTKIN